MRYISPLPGTAWRQAWPRRLSVLGSTGSIGVSALDVIRRQPEDFHLFALAGARNLTLLARQAAEFRPPFLGVLEETSVAELRRLLPAGYSPQILHGPEGYAELARLPEAHVVLSAQVGAAGLYATAAAVTAGKVIALANKESLVLAGHLIRRLCERSGAVILPVDSEHNAIFQCLAGSGALYSEDGAETRPTTQSTDEAHGTAPSQPGGTGGNHFPRRGPGQSPGFSPAHTVSRLILTASGGPFRGKSAAELAAVTVEDALAHPNWNMGAKITIDSATLMNKGLEMIEAQHLYGLPLSAIDVLVHKESIVHSLVEFADGSQLAQLGVPDMRVPIAYCLGFPRRLDTGVRRLNLAEAGALTFAPPDEALFPCLGLARQAQEAGNGSPVVLNAANEMAVEAFLLRRIGYLDIARIVERALAEHAAKTYSWDEPDTLEGIMALDAHTRTAVAAHCKFPVGTYTS